MENDRFWKRLLGLTAGGAALTLLHLGWVAWAVRHASIVAFIARELWWP